MNTHLKPGPQVIQKPQLTTEQLGTLAKLQLKLSSLGAEGDFLPIAQEGPVVTLYKFVPKNATRVGLIERLANDLAIAIGAECVQVGRILASPLSVFMSRTKLRTWYRSGTR